MFFSYSLETDRALETRVNNYKMTQFSKRDKTSLWLSGKLKKRHSEECNWFGSCVAMFLLKTVLIIKLHYIISGDC